MKTKVTMELDVPEGWEATGEFGRPKTDGTEASLIRAGEIRHSKSSLSYHYPILRKKLELKVGEVALWNDAAVMVLQLLSGWPCIAYFVHLNPVPNFLSGSMCRTEQSSLTPTGKTVPEFYAGGGK